MNLFFAIENIKIKIVILCHFCGSEMSNKILQLQREAGKDFPAQNQKRSNG